MRFLSSPEGLLTTGWKRPGYLERFKHTGELVDEWMTVWAARRLNSGFLGGMSVIIDSVEIGKRFKPKRKKNDDPIP